MLRKYETVIILKPDLPPEETDKVRERATSVVRNQGGVEIAWQDWGKRKLAYPIKKTPKGNYMYFRYLSDGKAVEEMERQMRVTDEVLRYLTVKLADRIDPEKFDVEEDKKGIFPFNARPREHYGDREDRPFDDMDRDRGEETSEFRGRDRGEETSEFRGRDRGEEGSEFRGREREEGGTEEEKDTPAASGSDERTEE